MEANEKTRSTKQLNLRLSDESHDTLESLTYLNDTRVSIEARIIIEAAFDDPDILEIVDENIRKEQTEDTKSEKSPRRHQCNIRLYEPLYEQLERRAKTLGESAATYGYFIVDKALSEILAEDSGVKELVGLRVKRREEKEAQIREIGRVIPSGKAS